MNFTKILPTVGIIVSAVFLFPTTTLAAVIAEQSVKDTMLAETGNPRQDFAPGTLKGGELYSITLSMAEIGSTQANHLGIIAVCFDDFPAYNTLCSGEGEMPYVLSTLEPVKGGAQQDYTFTFPPGFVFNSQHAYTFQLTGDETTWGAYIFGSRNNVHNGDNAENLYLTNGNRSPYNAVADLAFIIRTTDPEPTQTNLTQSVPEGTLLPSPTITWSATVSDPNSSNLKLEAEIRPVTEAFNETQSDKIYSSDFVTSGTTVTLTNTTLPNNHYHLRTRTVTTDGRRGTWHEFGTEGNTDFIKGNVPLEKTFGTTQCFPSTGSYGNFGMAQGYQKHGEVFSIPDVDVLKSITIGFADVPAGNIFVVGEPTDGVKITLYKYDDMQHVIAESNTLSGNEFFIIGEEGSAPTTFTFNDIKLNPNERYVFLLERTGAFDDAHYYMTRAYTSFVPNCDFRGDAHYIFQASDQIYYPENYNPVVAPDELGFQIHYVTKAPSDVLPVEESCAENCNSNVLFFPGTMGSRLFEDTGSFINSEKERWVSALDSYHERLALDTNGKSINSLYTKEGEDGTLASYGANIYQSFMDDLKKWKNTDHIIADYALMPYDWRLSLEDILNNGASTTESKLSYTQTGNFTDSYIYKKLTELVATSRTGKVTLIAHSNGGLVVKALLQKLKDNNDPLADKIDNVIFVAVPQIGTPDAVGTLLYGTDIGQWGAVMGPERVRDLLHNMPLGYNLLPSETFMNSTTTPLIEFTGPAIPPALTARYGAGIDTYAELIDYLFGGDGRSAPAFDDLHNASIANDTLLPAADILHQRLDQWTPSASTTLYEIAGWGLYTPAGLQYETNKECIPSMYQPAPTDGTPQPLACSGYKDTLKVNDKLTINGDATVMEESAHAMTLSSTTKKYWVDLLKYEDDHLIKREHRDIFEVDTMRAFIKSIIQGSRTLQSYITDDSSVLVTSKDYIKYSLHSPLNLNLYDAEGNHTGISTTTGQLEEGIKGSQYFTLGDTKTIILPASIAHTVNLNAYAFGSFTLDLTELQGDTIVASTTFMGIPTATTTQATLTWNPAQGISTTTALTVDYNGDQVTDTTLIATPGDTVLLPPTPPDTTPPEALITFSTSTNTISITGIDDSGTTTISSTTTYPVLKKNQKQYNGIATTTVTIKDVAGNTTKLIYTEKLPSPERRDVISLVSISYNGEVHTFGTTTLKYKWANKPDGSYKMFASTFSTSSVVIESHYRPKKNLTVIMQKPVEVDDSDEDDDVDTRPIKTKFGGFVVPMLTTSRGKIAVTY